MVFNFMVVVYQRLNRKQAPDSGGSPYEGLDLLTITGNSGDSGDSGD